MLDVRSVARASCAVGLCFSVFLACGSDNGKKAIRTDAEAGQGGVGGEATAGAPPAAEAGNAGAPGGVAGSAQGGEGGSALGPNDLGFLNQFCVDFAEKECAERETCFGALEGCRRNEVEYCHEYGRAELLPALAAGVLAYHADKAAQCFAAKVEGFCSANNLWMVKECSEIFTGTATGDEACYHVYFLGQTFDSCDDGACSAMPQTQCGTGRCTPYLADGATCVDAMNMPIAPGCGVGLRCDKTSKKCAPEKLRHEACTNPGEICGSMLPQVFCVPRADGAPGYECDAGRAAGKPCGETDGPQFSAACASLVCQGNVCVDKDLTGAQYCIATPCPKGQACLPGADNLVCGTPLKQGSPCHGDRECADGLVCVNDGNPQDPAAASCAPPAKTGESCMGVPCAAGLTCLVNGNTSECAPIALQGEDCTGSGQGTCAESLYCLSATSTCESRLLFGEACEYDRDCEGGLYCDADSGRCAPWKANGEPCTRNEECVYLNACTKGKCASMICSF